MTDIAPTNAVTLPPGWSISPGRETSQTSNGSVVQGMMFTLTDPVRNITTSVFVPYSVMTVPAAVQQLLVARINAVTAISG